MDDSPACPECDAPAGTPDTTGQLECSKCGHTWTSIDAALAATQTPLIAHDKRGNMLLDGDSVTLLESAPVPGSDAVVDAGTKLKNIRIIQGEQNIVCRVDGVGTIGVKSSVVEKA